MERGEAALNEIRRRVEEQRGHHVRIYSRRGRSKPQIREGVLEQTYPNVFTVMVAPGAMLAGGVEDVEDTMIATDSIVPSAVSSAIRPAPPERLSFSYSDLLTKHVRISDIGE